MMEHGTYKGPVHGDLKPGMTALLLTDMLGEPKGTVKAQFDAKLIVGQVDLSLGWHQFPAADFDLDPPATEAEVAAANSRRPGAKPDPQDGGPMHANLLARRPAR